MHMLPSLLPALNEGPGPFRKWASRAILLLLVCPLLNLPARGQETNPLLFPDTSTGRYLVLDKPGFVKRIRFYPGTRIKFKLKGESTKYEAVLQAVGEKSIIVFDTPIFLDEISKIYYTKPGSFLPLASGSLTSGGFLFALLGSLNGLTRNNFDLIVPGVLFVALGQAVKPFYQKSYRIKGNRRLRTL